MTGRKVEEKVRDFLGEALGIKRGDSVDAPADQTGEPAQEDPKESLKRNLFDGLLNAVFE